MSADLKKIQDDARNEALQAIKEMFETKLGMDDLLLVAQGAAYDNLEKHEGEPGQLLNLADVIGREAMNKFFASALGSATSAAKKKSSRDNGKLGGRPKKIK